VRYFPPLECVCFLLKTTEQREKCFTTNTKEKTFSPFVFLFKENNKSTQLLNSFFFSLFVVLTVSFRSRSKRKPKCRRFFSMLGVGGEVNGRERDWRACISCVCVFFSAVDLLRLYKIVCSFFFPRSRLSISIQSS
jgi:hypothetical protein